MLFVDGERRVVTRFPRTEDDSIVWYGKVGGRRRRAGRVRARSSLRRRPGRERRRRTPPIRVVDPLRRARPRPDRGRRGSAASRSASPPTRRPVRWKLGGRSGVARPGHAAPARAAAGGPVHADGDARTVTRRGQPCSCGSRRADRARPPRRRCSAARGLALLLVATRRELASPASSPGRVGPGGARRSTSLPTGAPRSCSSPPRGRGARRRRGGCLAAAPLALGARCSRRWPASPIRMPVDIGDEDANLLLPLYVVIGVARARARLAAAPRRRARPRARPARVAARGRRRLDGRRHCSGRTTCARARSSSPRSCSRSGCSRSASRGCRGSRRALLGLYGALVATALAYAGVGALPVGDARGLLEPEADRRQRVRPVLPRQLGLLGPVDLRPLPRRRDPGDAGARPARAARAARSPRRRRDRRDLGRPALLVLAVELRRADRGHARGRGGDLALACGRGARPCSPSCSSRSASRRRRCATSCCRVRAGLDTVTSGRAGLVSTGSDRRRPPRRSASARAASSARTPTDRAAGREPKKAASHSTPVTVAAETGVPGSRCSAGSASRRSLRPFARRAAGRMPAASRSSRALRLARSPCTASSTTRSSRIRRPGRCSAWSRSRAPHRPQEAEPA